jgi:hypothetical protein
MRYLRRYSDHDVQNPIAGFNSIDVNTCILTLRFALAQRRGPELPSLSLMTS